MDLSQMVTLDTDTLLGMAQENNPPVSSCEIRREPKRKLKYYKSYDLSHSPLFKIQYEKALCTILNIEPKTIKNILNQKSDYYHTAEIKAKKTRDSHTPINELQKIHHRLAQFLVRIHRPDYVYSGVKGKSYINNVQVHSHYFETFSTDISNFYPSTTQFIIFKFFRNKMQCSHQVANILAELCTLDKKLPIGSQISMILAFWANHDMFEELNQLAKIHKLMMTVYVDDITFSGTKIPAGFQQQVAQIIKKHGHLMSKKKTRLYQKYSHKEITGLIVDKTRKNLTPPNHFYLELHQSLSEFNKIYAEMRIGKSSILQYQLRKLHNRLMGLLNHVAQFDNKYIPVKKHIKKQYHDMISGKFQKPPKKENLSCSNKRKYSNRYSYSSYDEGGLSGLGELLSVHDWDIQNID